jgi:hypothetical protein
MECEDSLLYSQEPTTVSCPEPDESSAHPHTLFVFLRSIFILSSSMSYVSQVVSYLQVFWLKFFMYFSSLPYMLRAMIAQSV